MEVNIHTNTHTSHQMSKETRRIIMGVDITETTQTLKA